MIKDIRKVIRKYFNGTVPEHLLKQNSDSTVRLIIFDADCEELKANEQLLSFLKSHYHVQQISVDEYLILMKEQSSG